MKLNRKRDLNKCGIYCIRNKINHKVYIGKSINIYTRIKQHITYLNTQSKDENYHLKNSWKKYGKENFEYFVLEYLDKNDSLLSERELYWMNVYKSFDRDFGYNLRLDSSTKCILPEETKKRMSESKLKLYSNPNYDKSKHSHDFWKNNPEAKKRMAEKVSKKAQKYFFEQYSRDGKLIKTWNSVKEIINENPNYKWQNIYSVCNGYKKTYMDFVWKKKKLNEEIVQS